jgi:hypothetical protein
VGGLDANIVREDKDRAAVGAGFIGDIAQYLAMVRLDK